ncbi:hypothetical protein [Emticicia sp. 21SJ11W-3]|uniref:hypothetical protein n=1 Tax=Emticicia sp. 21SJ11W-3 TaxID=2916755 RepID=UPI00209F4FAD|nr:hypothetical protein [Emticicia sp. 21SJ11W-3]UTA66598.1 hypothetical protein MB380_13410 [Emticicia sp. 21SJ11W-3]
MKPIIVFCILLLLLSSYENINMNCCENQDTETEIAVLKKNTSIDLLNQSQPGQYVFGNIALAYG